MKDKKVRVQFEALPENLLNNLANPIKEHLVRLVAFHETTFIRKEISDAGSNEAVEKRQNCSGRACSSVFCYHLSSWNSKEFKLPQKPEKQAFPLQNHFLDSLNRLSMIWCCRIIFNEEFKYL